MENNEDKIIRMLKWKAAALYIGVLVFGFLAGAFFMTMQCIR